MITLIKVGEVYPLHFVATIPGSFMVIGLIFALFSYINPQTYKSQEGFTMTLSLLAYYLFSRAPSLFMASV